MHDLLAEIPSQRSSTPGRRSAGRASAPRKDRRNLDRDRLQGDSVDADSATPEPLLACNRGHGSVENANHDRRDATMGEKVSRVRTRLAPANSATLDNIALAVVFQGGFRDLPEANLHYMLHCDDTVDAVLSPS